MRTTLTFIAASTALIAGCATTAPAGLPAGKFVSMACADNKAIQVRMSDDGRTARVRSHHGSAELDKQPDGRYAGDGYVLNLTAEAGASLDHAGKSQGKGCKAG